MKTTFDINDILYSIINVSAVKNTIDGGVYRNKKPLNSEAQDIVILPLSNYVGSEIINEATFMINCFCKNFVNGSPNIVRLKATVNAVISEIEKIAANLFYLPASEALINYKNIIEAEQSYKPVKTYNTSNYYIFDIVNQILLNDSDQVSMSYINLRMNCLIEK